MRTVLLAYNNDTRRCHRVVPGCLALRNPQELIRVTAVPKDADLVDICLRVERNAGFRNRRGGCYTEICKAARKLKHAG